jgi:hypothetical protein
MFLNGPSEYFASGQIRIPPNIESSAFQPFGKKAYDGLIFASIADENSKRGLPSVEPICGARKGNIQRIQGRYELPVKPTCPSSSGVLGAGNALNR